MILKRAAVRTRPQIHELCRRFNVSRLEIFGSAADPEHVEDPNDFDFLVDFNRNGELRALDAYFGLKESLEDLLGLPVDLVMPSALKNPYIRAQVERQRQPLYEA
jgi:predicted nucleotidyltransferase